MRGSFFNASVLFDCTNLKEIYAKDLKWQTSEEPTDSGSCQIINIIQLIC